jgi:hypothetical protein
MGHKGIDQRPYNRDKFNSEFDRIFGKKGEKNESSNAVRESERLSGEWEKAYPKDSVSGARDNESDSKDS